MIFHKILIVDDDDKLGHALKDFLEDNDFKVIYVASGEEAVDAFKKECPSLVLLDVMLPGMNGFEVLDKIQYIDNQTPVIMMTGTEYNEANQIKGYNSRAISYLQKPVSPFILLAKINMLLSPPKTKKYNLGSYTITIQNREVSIKGEVYTLTEKEVRILSILLRKKSDLVSRDELKQFLCVSDKTDKENYLDSSISAIKRILKKYPGIEIKNIYGEGYKLGLVTAKPC